MKKILLTSAAIVLVLLFTSCTDNSEKTSNKVPAILEHNPEVQVGQLKEGEYLLPTNRIITPVGKNILLNGRPNAIALSSDGKIAAALNATGNTVVVLDIEGDSVKQSIKTIPIEAFPIPGKISPDVIVTRLPSGSFAGIIFSHDDNTIYASQSNGSIIIATKGEDGLFTPTTVPLPKNQNDTRDSKGNPYPGGLALSDDGNTLYICFNRNNTLAVMDLSSKEIIAEIPVGNVPADVIVSGDRAFVSNRAGRKVQKGDLAVKSSGTPVVVDKKSAYTISGTISVVDLKTNKETSTIDVGMQPTRMTLYKDRLFVANTSDDAVSIIDINELKVVKTINTVPFAGAMTGSSPTSVAVANDTTLLVTLGRNNAVAVYGLPEKNYDRVEFLGLIPAGWYPGDIVVDRNTGNMIVANTKGIGSQGPKVIGGPGMTVMGTKPTSTKGKWSYSHRGSVSIIPIPNQDDLFAYTGTVLKNNSWEDIEERQQKKVAKSNKKPIPMPKNLGDPSVFKHVFFIIKENKTYDQFMGDIEKGNGDTTLVQFGRKYTPNHHALAEDFVLFDNLYIASSASVDGHQWMTQAFCSDYIEKAFGGMIRSYPFSGFDPMVYPKTGFIWEHAEKAGRSVRVFGEYADLFSDTYGRMGPWISKVSASGSDNWGGGWQKFYDDYLILRGEKEGKLHTKLETRSQIPSLQRVLDPDYPSFNFAVPDVYRAEIFLDKFEDYVKNDNLPEFVIMALPNDHTLAFYPGFPKTYSMVADNDLALGRIVEAISNSKYWKESVIFIIEDDAQDGVDHVDGHRTFGFVISPYTKRKVVDSKYYTNLDFTRAMLQILGVPPISQMDMATDPQSMANVFTDKPDFTPHKCLIPGIELNVMNPPLHAMADGLKKEWALAMTKLNWEDVDGADWPMVNRAIWYATKGFDVSYPGDSRVLHPYEVYDYINKKRNG